MDRLLDELVVLVERERDWIGNQRFSGDKFQAKSLSQLKRVQGITRRHGWEFRQDLGAHNGLRREQS